MSPPSSGELLFSPTFYPIADSRSPRIGIAYAGTQREDIRELLIAAISDTAVSMEIASMSALALGFIFVGSCDGEVTMAILQTMMEREEVELKEKWGRFLSLGLALLYLGASASFASKDHILTFLYLVGRQDDADATIETLKAVEAPIGKQALVLVDVCSFAGTGNVLKIQTMLNHCHDHIDPEKEDDAHQTMAVLGIALISMGEDVGAEMAIRQFNHLVRPFSVAGPSLC